MDIYTDAMLNVTDTARYLAIPESTLRNWRNVGIIHGVEAQRRGWPQLPFVAVVEAFVLDRLRKMKIPARHIKEAANGIKEKLGDPYGLARPGLGVHGKDILIQVAGEFYRGADLQQAASETIQDFTELITWSGNDPQRLKLPNFGADVILDPRFGWGAPVTELNKVPVESIIGQYIGGDKPHQIAYDFDLSVDDVDNVIRGYLDSTLRAAS